jgi:DNA (cytosine-5)-methyltransferase 1
MRPKSVTNRRRALDLFCGQGGVSAGLVAAGCDVTGVDTEPQPRYPFRFLQEDALTVPLDGFDLIWASPPCQAYSRASRKHRADGKEYPDLIGPVRDRLIASGIPYVIENVEGAPLVDPVLLCGIMPAFAFPVHRTYRHRLFECSFPVMQPYHPVHPSPVTRMGRTPGTGWFRSVAGNSPGADDIRDEWAMPWATIDGISQAVPPAYSCYIASHGGTRQCESCGRWWSPKRSHARTCTPACRKALSRSIMASNSLLVH